MSEQSNRLGETSGHEAVEKMIASRVSQARKEEVLEIYEDLLSTIWNRILPTLGRVTVMAITERALTLTAENFPSVGLLQATKDGLSFDQLRARVGEEERDVLRDALRELVANLIDILAMLTGDILVRQLIKEIEGRQTP